MRSCCSQRNNERRKNKKGYFHRLSTLTFSSDLGSAHCRQNWSAICSQRLGCGLCRSTILRTRMQQVDRQDRQDRHQASLAGHRPSAQVSRVSHLPRTSCARQKNTGRISNHQAKGPCCAAHRDCTGPPSHPEIVRIIRERSDGVV